ncbi:hypothetical protein NIES2107_72190 (plasmid) [Nostoc carneum NIES-2107]|nr:hypothetical protein NIES2107_72190 [Nostoc carneum NIES-2107]
MKQEQIILGSITATVSAIGLGYLGAQYLNQTTMYTVAGAMMGLGATVQLRQLKPKSKSPTPRLLLLPAAASIPVHDEPQPQLMQPLFQSIEQSAEQHHEIIELEPSTEVIELRSEVDPVIERFLKLGLEEF